MPLTYDFRLKILVGATKGIKYLHKVLRYPIIHQNLKSSNILIDTRYNAKISDYGLNRIIPKASYYPEGTTALQEWLSYQPPELNLVEINPSYDVYSFGVVSTG